MNGLHPLATTIQLNRACKLRLGEKIECGESVQTTTTITEERSKKKKETKKQNKNEQQMSVTK